MIRDARPATRSILLAAALSLMAGTATARPADSNLPALPDTAAAAAYAKLVFRYAAGEHSAAVAEARRLTTEELRFRRDWLLRLRKSAAEEGRAAERGIIPDPVDRESGASWCPACSLRKAWERFPLSSAVLMHGEASWSAPDGDQLQMALDLAQLLPERDGGKETAVAFFLAVGYRMQNQGDIEAARSWMSEGLKRFPREPLLLLAAGTIQETLAAVGYAPSYRLDRAARLFQAARDAQPDLHEARLRLGRVEWRKGRPAQAERLYREVLAAESGAEMRYLAQLFLGRIQEDQGLFDEAASSYRAALALDPEAQTALLALSHALYRLGAEQESRDLVERSVVLAGSRKRVDVFGAYFLGRSGAHEAVWEWLRAAARREAQP